MLKSYKIRVNSVKESTKVQEQAFALGYRWGASKTKIVNTYAEVIYLSHTGRITYGSYNKFFKFNNLKEISIGNFINEIYPIY